MEKQLGQKVTEYKQLELHSSNIKSRVDSLEGKLKEANNSITKHSKGAPSCL